jgi:acetyl-CoA carboxylase biotin carboxyl carrier protein
MSGQAEHEAGDAMDATERTLLVIRRIAAEVLLDLPKPPRGLRLRAGEVSLELDWQESPAAAPQVAAGGHHAEPARSGQAGHEAGHETRHGARQEPDRGAMVCAPMVGVFYRAPQPGAAPFVTEGDHVTKGQQVAIIEAMKLMIPVEADWPGRITSVLVPDGQSVEYGQPLFAVDQDS